MAYETRYEVLEAAAAWMRVCEKAGVTARYKHRGITGEVQNTAFCGSPFEYEFPLALLEGKEVWVGSELYHSPYGDGIWYKFIAGEGHANRGGITPLEKCSWNPPKPKTVMVELSREDAEFLSKQFYHRNHDSIGIACQEALEKI